MMYVDLFGRVCAEPTDKGYGWRPKAGDIRDELRALRTWMAKRDRNPWHGFSPCRKRQHAHPPAVSGVIGAPTAELLRFQRGEPAYGAQVAQSQKT